MKPVRGVLLNGVLLNVVLLNVVNQVVQDNTNVLMRDCQRWLLMRHFHSSQNSRFSLFVFLDSRPGTPSPNRNLIRYSCW